MIFYLNTLRPGHITLRDLDSTKSVSHSLYCCQITLSRIKCACKHVVSNYKKKPLGKFVLYQLVEAVSITIPTLGKHPVTRYYCIIHISSSNLWLTKLSLTKKKISTPRDRAYYMDVLARDYNKITMKLLVMRLPRNFVFTDLATLYFSKLSPASKARFCTLL